MNCYIYEWKCYERGYTKVKFITYSLTPYIFLKRKMGYQRVYFSLKRVWDFVLSYINFLLFYRHLLWRCRKYLVLSIKYSCFINVFQIIFIERKELKVKRFKFCFNPFYYRSVPSVFANRIPFLAKQLQRDIFLTSLCILM